MTRRQQASYLNVLEKQDFCIMFMSMFMFMLIHPHQSEWLLQVWLLW